MSLAYGVVTATLNSAATIQRSIDSVLSQSPPPAQWVFVDGHSTDGTRDLIAAARQHCVDHAIPTAIQLLDEEPGAGIYGAFNQGIDALDTDLVFILNADDWYAPHAAATVLQAFADDPQADIVAAAIDLYQTPDDPAPRPMPPRSPALFPVLMPIMHPACFVRRAVYQRHGLYDPTLRISADYEWAYRVHRAGAQFRLLPDHVLTHMLAGGMALSHRDAARRETRDAARRHCPIPGLPDLAYLLRRLTGR